MTVITRAKVARNLTRSFFEMGHKRCNSSDHISMSEICAWELRATLLGNQPDWKPTHETAAWVHWYNTRRPHLALGGITPQQAENQHTTSRKEAASTSLHKTRDLTNNARATAPVTGRDTRYGALHPLRGATPDQKGCTAYGSGAHPITRTNAESVRRSPTRRQHAGGQLLMLLTPTAQVKTVAQGANLDGPIGERTGRPGRGCRGCRETGK